MLTTIQVFSFSRLEILYFSNNIEHKKELLILIAKFIAYKTKNNKCQR